MLLSLTTFFFDFAEAVSQLQGRVTELEGQIQAKEQERLQVVEVCEQLEKALSDQAGRHADEIRKLKDGENILKAEFESVRSG